MDLNVLIRQLNDWADIVELSGDVTAAGIVYDKNDLAGALRKAAEVIKLQRECISEELNEQYKRGLDSVL